MHFQAVLISISTAKQYHQPILVSNADFAGPGDGSQVPIEATSLADGGNTGSGST